ncbi:MAG: hypothetical protein MR691_14915 [Clostridium sp.]|nr:hypothetical protein [Clostridium sp.]
MEKIKNKSKEQLLEELKKEKRDNLKLIVENSALIKQVDRLLKVVDFLTKGE